MAFLSKGKRQTLCHRPTARWLPPAPSQRFIFSSAAPYSVNYAWTAWNRVDGYLPQWGRLGLSFFNPLPSAVSQDRHTFLPARWHLLTHPRVIVGQDSCADDAVSVDRRCQIVCSVSLPRFQSMTLTLTAVIWSHSPALSCWSWSGWWRRTATSRRGLLQWWESLFLATFSMCRSHTRAGIQLAAQIKMDPSVQLRCVSLTVHFLLVRLRPGCQNDWKPGARGLQEANWIHWGAEKEEY